MGELFPQLCGTVQGLQVVGLRVSGLPGSRFLVEAAPEAHRLASEIPYAPRASPWRGMQSVLSN